MREQAEPSERRLALDPRRDVVGQREALEGGTGHELTGVEDERPAVAELDELGQVLLRLLGVDERRGVVAEHAEVAVDVEVGPSPPERPRTIVTVSPERQHVAKEGARRRARRRARVRSCASRAWRA